MLFHKDEIRSWALKNNITKLLELYEWLVTDFEYIRRLNPDEKKITEFATVVAQLSVSIIVSDIILGNNIAFTAEAYGIYTRGKDAFSDGQHNDKLVIIDSWIERFTSTIN